MKSNKFEQTFEQYHNDEDYELKIDEWSEQLRELIFQITRHAFKAGWTLAGGELPETEKVET